MLPVMSLPFPALTIHFPDSSPRTWARGLAPRRGKTRRGKMHSAAETGGKVRHPHSPCSFLQSPQTSRPLHHHPEVPAFLSQRLLSKLRMSL